LKEEGKSKRRPFSIEFFKELYNLLKPYEIIAKKGFEKGHIIKNLFSFSHIQINKLKEFSLPYELISELEIIQKKIEPLGDRLNSEPAILKEIYLSINRLIEGGIDLFLKTSFYLFKKRVNEVRGIGDALSRSLAERGIHTIRDFIFFIPKRYQDRRNFVPIKDLVEGMPCAIRGKLLDFGIIEFKKRKAFEAIFSDETGFLSAKWFHYKSIPFHRILKRGQEYFLFGIPSRYGDRFELIHPELRSDDREFGEIIPVYPEIKGLPRQKLRGIMEKVLKENENFITSCVPPSIERKINLPSLSRSIYRLHFPDKNDDFQRLNNGTSIYHKRLLFEEIFSLELAMLKRRTLIKERKGPILTMRGEMPQKMIKNLPFQLTSAQKKVVSEIEEDLKNKRLLYRVIQGDVGCGKTVVVAIVSLYFIEDDYQVALMVPTEILAIQHYNTIRAFYSPLGVDVGILRGGMKEKEKRETADAVKEGKIKFLIGTHALLEEYVEFKNLALVIVDEQHRFGVLQRAFMKKKGPSPHLIVMSATPIPRTLAMTIYGDLDISIIDEMPRKRRVKTLLYHYSEIERVYEELRKEVKDGGRVFVIYPLIEESESVDLKNAKEMFIKFKEKIFPDLRVGLLHGKMRPSEKDEVMNAFRNNEIDLLVATTVVEVGIDVPEATMMVIENADRFGLSQLHQLRGRIGRGEKEGKCILLTNERVGEKAWKRLKIMTETDDGFKIAEEDLKIRGPGEILGTRQWGFKSSELIKYLQDIKLLKLAKEMASYISSPEFPYWERKLCEEVLKETKGELLEISITA
jgi:ATP-dependent DNA helicase RecG